MLEYIDNMLNNWKDPNYTGMDHIYNCKYGNVTYEEIIQYKTMIDKSMVPVLKTNKNKISEYSDDADGLTAFLLDYNFKHEKKVNYKNPKHFRMEGSSTQQHLDEHSKYVNDKTKYIMEVGFNAGLSAINFLKHSPNSIVISFDIALHEYCWYAKMFIDEKYPGRHILISGDSKINIPAFSLTSNIKFDVIFIDGYHSVFYAYSDMINSKPLSSDDTILILDNVAPHLNCAAGPYVAMNMLMKEGHIKFIKHIEIGDYTDGFAVLKFVDTPSKLTSNEYVKIERRVPTNILYNYIELMTKDNPVNSVNADLIKTVNEYINKFEKYNLEIDTGLLNLIEKLK